MAKAIAGKGDNTLSNSLADFKQLSLLGEGAYSAVYKVLRLADREIYALKKVKLPSLSDKEKQNALNEVRLLASIRHESIIGYKEAFFDDKTRCLCIITDYADSGDLFQLITKCQKARNHIVENDVWRYIHGMLHGLKALHDMRILHRDLKCANVFLSTCPRTKEVIALLGDFNVSKVAKRGLCMTQTGTPYYASPEVWRDMPYDAKSDMWSIGCVLYEMVALRPPFRAEDMEGLYRKVLRGQYPRIPPHYSHDLSEVIGVLLQVNPRHRPSVEQLLQMPVMKRHAPDASYEADTHINDLLATIKLPKNAIDLSSCLPKPQYDISFETYMNDDSDLAPSPQKVVASQESAADIAGGTRAKRALAMMAGRGQPAVPPPPIDVGTGPYQDSIDAYLAPQQESVTPPPPLSQVGAATIDTPIRHHGGHSVGPHAAHNRGGDSLDDYISQKNRLPPAPGAQRSSNEDQDSISAAAQLRQSANPRALRGLARQEQHSEATPPKADYGGGRADYGGDRGRGPPVYQQNSAYPGLPQAAPRYNAEYGAEPREAPRRASPAPSSLQSHAQRGTPAAYGGGREQYRHGRGGDRKPMASYARPQYALGAAAPAAPAASRAPSGGGGLRLPRIFTKG